MPKGPIRILAINPGTKYLGIAVLQDGDLRDWKIKVIPGKWSDRKFLKVQAIITDLFWQYQPDHVALKSLDPSRRSGHLERIVDEIRTIAGKKGIGMHEYAIEDLKRFYSPEERINERQLAELIIADYPALFHELDRDWDEEKKRLRKYYSRMFEAVALGTLCFYSLDKK